MKKILTVFLLLLPFGNAFEAAKLERQERRIEEIEIIIEERPKLPLVHRGLVPQLWPNYTGPELPEAQEVPCDVAQTKCAFRSGCSLALQNYALGCLTLVKGATEVCNSHCRHSLIALMSTVEGQRLMKCNCSNDEFCLQSKKNIKPCQDEVIHATQMDTVVSCTAAQWICAADPMCSTALEYYNRFCQAMFRGKKCTARCMNSIDILRRQKAAQKLENCQCDGTEEYDCQNIKINMENLCLAPSQMEDNEIDVDYGSQPRKKSSSWRLQVHKWLVLLLTILSVLFRGIEGAISELFS